MGDIEQIVAEHRDGRYRRDRWQNIEMVVIEEIGAEHRDGRYRRDRCRT